MRIRAKIPILAMLFAAAAAGGAVAQTVRPDAGERIFVRGGVAKIAVENRANVNLGAMTPDSLFRFMAAVDSLRGDGIRFDRRQTDSLVMAMLDRTSPTGDSLPAEKLDELLAKRRLETLNPATVRRLMDDSRFIARYIGGGVDTLLPKLIAPDTLGLTRRQARILARRDTTASRYNRFFRDSIGISRMTAISLAVPGFSQFYNEQYWKIPVAYGTILAGVGVGLWQHNIFKPYRDLYNHYVVRPPTGAATDPNYAAKWEAYRQTLTDLQGRMITHNTYRQLAFGFAAASYIYFLVDGVLNYPSEINNVKKATTLATICPGAGQVYNGDYWKLPIVVGGTAALIYCVDFNNRGYQRFKRAYDALTNEDPNVIDEFGGTRSAEQLLNWKNSYRRNRDLCIILTGLFYVVQLVDAHATAHMKSYDISDDLSAVTFGPSMDNFFSYRLGGNVNTFGFSMNIRF